MPPAAMPPTFWRRLVRATVPHEDGETVCSDLDEIYGVRLARHGRRAATAWYARQAIGFVARVGVRRMADALGGADSLRADARCTLRAFRRRPAFPLAFVLTLAIGIGVVSTVYAAARWVLLRPVPGVDRPDELVTLRLGGDGMPAFVSWDVSQPDLETLRARLEVPALAGRTPIEVDLGMATGAPRHLAGELVSANYFTVLGARMMAGRPFVPADEAGAFDRPPVILAHRLATSMGLTPESALGVELRVNSRVVVVVGVATPGFRGAELPGAAELWLPLPARSLVDPTSPAGVATAREVGVWRTMVLRLPASMNASLVEDRANAIMEQIRQEFAVHGFGAMILHFQAFPGIGLDPGVRETVRRTLGLLGAAAGLLLLLSIANLTNLALIRATMDDTVVAIRYALGAGRSRLVRAVMVESVMLALAGAAAAMLVAFVWSRWYQATQLSEHGGSLAGLALDWRTGVLAFGVAVAASLAAFLQPVLATGAASIERRLRRGSAGATTGGRLRMGLVSVQVALSVVLLVAAGLLGRTVLNLREVDLGFDAGRILTFSLDPGAHGFQPAPLAQLVATAERELSATPGVAGAGIISPSPLGSGWVTSALYGSTDPEVRPMVGAGYYVTAGLLPALGARVVAGDRQWQADSGTMVLTRGAVQALYPGLPIEEAVGRLVPTRTRGRDPVRIAAVIEDLRLNDITAEPPPGVFRSMRERPPGYSMTVVVATPGRPDQVEPAVRRVMEAVVPDLPIFQVRTARELVDLQFAERNALARVAVTLGGIGLLLAAIGLYGVLASAVAARQREFGVRAAIGAGPRRLLANVMRGGLLPVSLGIGAGVFGAVAISGALSHQLYGLERFDPTVYVGALAAILLTAGVACAVPAVRASRVSPAEVLRDE